MIVYGPYKREDGRSIVIHYDEILKTRRTQSYPRYLMEQHLGRELESWEQVDHINDDPTDNRIENFQLLTASENIKKSSKGVSYTELICDNCDESFLTETKRYTYAKRNGRVMFYCSRSCSGTAAGIMSGISRR